MTTIDDLKPEAIVRVAQNHAAHFRELLTLRAGNDLVREDECTRYLRIWESVVIKGGVGLSRLEADEVLDADFAGGHFGPGDRV